MPLPFADDQCEVSWWTRGLGTAEVIESRNGEWDAARTDDIRVTGSSAPLHLILIFVILSSPPPSEPVSAGRHSSSD